MDNKEKDDKLDKKSVATIRMDSITELYKKEILDTRITVSVISRDSKVEKPGQDEPRGVPVVNRQYVSK